uniref:Uncharacterized protein n=1 Tax=Hyaloperonospora arabidopsidis (strain Emoy2) TaxID=559515 RepID=M4BF54_HYAAE
MTMTWICNPHRPSRSPCGCDSVNELLVGRLYPLRRPKNSVETSRSCQESQTPQRVRVAVGVLLAGVVQTHGNDREWLFLPASYYLGGLTVASMMVIYAATNTVGGVLEQVWQIDVGVAIALLYNFVVFACVPLKQGNLLTVSQNLNGNSTDGNDYYGL